jgi:hypothetical protein
LRFAVGRGNIDQIGGRLAPRENVNESYYKYTPRESPAHPQFKNQTTRIELKKKQESSSARQRADGGAQKKTRIELPLVELIHNVSSILQLASI